MHKSQISKNIPNFAVRHEEIQTILLALEEKFQIFYSNTRFLYKAIIILIWVDIRHIIEDKQAHQI